jgi:hypothetical protein
VTVSDWVERTGVDGAAHVGMLIVNSRFRQIIAGFDKQ